MKKKCFWMKTQKGTFAHINASGNMSKETLAAIEAMIDAAAGMMKNV